MQKNHTNNDKLSATTKSSDREDLVLRSPHSPPRSWVMVHKDDLSNNMQSTYSVIPSFVTTDHTLTDSAKILLSVITSMMGQFGFCFASNKYLAKTTAKSERQVQRNLELLKKKKLIIVEIEDRFDRKIWTPGTWAYRDHYLKIFGEHLINSSNRDEFNQRFYGYDTHDVGGTTSMTSYKTSIIQEQKHREAPAPVPVPTPPPKKSKTSPPRDWRPPIPQKKRKEPRQLPHFMTKMTPPTPGPVAMVKETRALLDEPMQIGGEKLLMHDKDKPFFYGFSPTIVRGAIEKTSKASAFGRMIRNIPAMIFKYCIEIKKAQG